MTTTAIDQRVSVMARMLPFARVLRTAGICMLSGYVAGVIAGGIGSRVAMRIVSLVAGHERYGELTEAEASVGRISADGTLFLLLFGGALGLGAAVLFLVTRRWLPLHGSRLGLAFGGLLLLTLGPLVIDGENFDFATFGSPTLNILMFAALFPLYGLVIAGCFTWLDRRVSGAPPHGIRLVPWLVLLLVGAIGFSLGLLMLSIIIVGFHNLTSVLCVYLLIAAPLLARRLARAHPARLVAGYTAAVSVVVGGAYLALQVFNIYSA